MKVALVLCRTLGDVVLIHNLVDGIRKKYGDVEIDVYVNEMYKNLVEGNPYITNIKTSVNWLDNWDKVSKLILTDYYDDFLIPQQIHWEDTVWHQLSEYRFGHLLDYYLERSRLPKRDEGDVLKLFITDEDRKRIKEKLEEESVPVNNYIVMHTTSGVPTKDWDGFNGLAQKFVDDGEIIVQVGIPADKGLEGEFGERYIDLRGVLSFREIAELCRNSKCFIGLDSGISYISAASNAVTVVLQGSTVPETSGPFGLNVVNILSPTLPECKALRCHTNCRFPKRANGKCINFLTVDKVYDIIKRKVYDESNSGEETK